MTPAEEDALAKMVIAEWMETRDQPDGLLRLSRLAIRAAYAQGVKDAEERRDDRIDCLMRDMERD